ncbi:MAG: putative geopeptide radical SAM maturase [Geobacteraceae bacterium GWC2_55_20]|nr:MAG: putative geopeptide radical SAM maturase [Geobacteraceae bacterium GWC2_55_20]OGU23773.1 MAG: putative geopeptide radical SAM maturase [Geobacteraceae bacterium GWF2_54_21]HBA73169.1 putative geopeptide radical SAM maturase [Geobacter sp.]
MDLSGFIKIYHGSGENDLFLIYSTLRGTLLQVSRSVADALQGGGLKGPEQEIMVWLGILVPDAETEKRQVAGYFDWANANARRFTALVTLNQDCNPVGPGGHGNRPCAIEHMSEATAGLLVEKILKKPMAAGREVLLEFRGVEALLSLPLIRRIAGPLREAAVANGTEFSFDLVTGGRLLTRDVVEDLLPLGLAGARVNIDVPAGCGDYGVVLNNIRQVCDLLKIRVMGRFTRENHRRVPELLDLLEQGGITPDMIQMVQFSPLVPGDETAGTGAFPSGCACGGEPWQTEASLQLRGEILGRGWSTPKPKLADCMVELENDLVVDRDGSLYKCPAFMGRDDMKIGSLTGGIEDYRKSHNLGVWKNGTCLECPYLPLCFGGCRFMQYQRSGAIDVVDCRKEYFDAVLERIVRQDIEFRRK